MVAQTTIISPPLYTRGEDEIAALYGLLREAVGIHPVAVTREAPSGAVSEHIGRVLTVTGEWVTIIDLRREEFSRMPLTEITHAVARDEEREWYA